MLGLVVTVGKYCERASTNQRPRSQKVIRGRGDFLAGRTRLLFQFVQLRVVEDLPPVSRGLCHLSAGSHAKSPMPFAAAWGSLLIGGRARNRWTHILGTNTATRNQQKDCGECGWQNDSGSS